MLNIEKQTIQLNGIPAILYGKPSRKMFLYIHGQGGSKEEAEAFSNIACRRGWQVLSIDLPEHGDRKSEKDAFNPWHVVPELTMVMEFAKLKWKHISLFANSIGAWFSMLSFGKEKLRRCLFVSPVLDMKQLISKMMSWADISEDQLKRELVIPTSFGQTLSWEYWEYALMHPIVNWKAPTEILYGENDNMIDRDTIEQFTRRYDCTLTVMKDGEHRFHTDQQLAFMRKWISKGLKDRQSALMIQQR